MNAAHRSVFCLIAIAMLAFVSSTTAEERPPNIVLIMVDDLGKDWISCYGADGIKTPEI